MKIMVISVCNHIIKDTVSELSAQNIQYQIVEPRTKDITNIYMLMDNIDGILINLGDMNLAYYENISRALGFRWNRPIPIICFGTKDECEQFKNEWAQCKKKTGTDLNYIYSKNVTLKFYFIKRPVTNSDIAERVAAILSGIEKDTQKMRKLVLIDDDALLLRRYKNELENMYKVYVSTTGANGLALVEKQNPDAILLDYDMPGFNGKQVFDMIKSNSQMCNIPVFFLTSVCDKDRVTDILKMQPAGYILKNNISTSVLTVLNDYFSKSPN